MTRKNLFLVLVLGCLPAIPGWAQTAVGRIVGNVTDASGAPVDGVAVSANDRRTGQQRTATTDGGGGFILGQLAPSSYDLEVKRTGFADAKIENVTLQVGQELVRNVVLQVAGTSTAITVEGGALAQVDTSSARMGVNVSAREVAQLPLNGRQVSQLYLLAPGAVNNGSGTFDNIRFSGRSNQQNVIRFDGVEAGSIIDASPGNLNGETSSNFRLQQSLENVQEFRVDSSNYPAEYGTGTGGQVSFITKSGSNQVHGSLFEYFRNDALDARNFFARSSKDELRLNQFGGSVGGAIIKDKLFVFGSYEGLRQRTATPFVETTLSPLARSKAVPSIQPLLAAFPQGGFASSDPLLNIVTVNGPGLVDENSGGIRIDYNINDRFRMYARYFRDQGISSQTQNSTLSKYDQTAVPQNAVLSVDQTYGATMLNETKIGFNGVKERVSGQPGPSPGVDLSGVTLNLSGSVALAGIAGQTGNAGIAVPTGLIRLSSAFNGRGAPYTNYSFSFIDNLSVVRGSHNMKYGVEFRPISLYNDQLGGTTYSFANVTAFLNNTPSSIAFNGDLSALSPFTGLSGRAHLRQNYFVLYAQDEWRIRPNLTMSYGLRYEYYTPLSETRDKDVFFDINRGDIIPRFSGDWYRSSKLNFGPRLAFSWSPQRLRNTVLRVGGGYYYGPGQTEDQLQPEANDRIGTTITSGPQLSYPLNIPAVYASYDINNPKLGFQPRAYAPGYHIPEKILSYTASVQQNFPGNTVLTVAYVGSQGRNLFLRSITNKIIGVTMDPVSGAGTAVREFGSRFAEIDYKTSGGTDHYDSLQATLNRRFSTGLSLGGQYTWGHSIGNSAGSNEANTAGNPFDFEADRGNNNFDIRQSFNLSALYALPFGRHGRFGSGLPSAANYVLGDWQLGGIVNARTGVPVDVLIVRPDIAYVDRRDGAVYSSPVLDADNGTIYTVPVVNTPGGGASRNVRRPDVVGGVNPYLNQDRSVINPAAFSVPAPGTFGNSGRNSLAGPALGQVDLTISKHFPVTESVNVEFRAELYNIANHANFANPANLRLAQGIPAGGKFAGGVVPKGSSVQPGQAFSSGNAGGNFGVENATVSNQIGLGTNRQIQLSLRVNF